MTRSWIATCLPHAAAIGLTAPRCVFSAATLTQRLPREAILDWLRFARTLTRGLFEPALEAESLARRVEFVSIAASLGVCPEWAEEPPGDADERLLRFLADCDYHVARAKLLLTAKLGCGFELLTYESIARARESTRTSLRSSNTVVTPNLGLTLTLPPQEESGFSAALSTSAEAAFVSGAGVFEFADAEDSVAPPRSSVAALAAIGRVLASIGDDAAVPERPVLVSGLSE
jgi:hypothetical protein